MTAAPARDMLVTRLASTARSHAPEPNPESLGAGRTTPTGAGPRSSGARSHRSYSDHSNAVTAALPDATTPAASAVAASPIAAASATVFIAALRLRTNRRGRGGFGSGRELLKDPLGARLAFGRGSLEIAQDPRVVRKDLAWSPARVDAFQRHLRRLADRGGFRDEHGHPLAGGALGGRPPADRVIVAGLHQFRVVAPEPGPIISERLLDGAPLRRGATDFAERSLPELGERGAR